MACRGLLAESSRVPFKLVAQRGRERVQVLVRMADVEPRDEERGGELRQAEQDAEAHVAEDSDVHEALGIGGEQDVGEVPDEERRGHRERKPAEPAAKLSELRRGLNLSLIHISEPTRPY